MFWIGLIALVIFLCVNDISLGAIILWVSVYAILGTIISFARWNRRRQSVIRVPSLSRIGGEGTTFAQCFLQKIETFQFCKGGIKGLVPSEVITLSQSFIFIYPPFLSPRGYFLLRGGIFLLSGAPHFFYSAGALFCARWPRPGGEADLAIWWFKGKIKNKAQNRPKFEFLFFLP